MALARALLLHLAVPSWTTDAHLARVWEQLIGPTLDAVLDSGNPVGLVLSGRLIELAPPEQAERLDALRTALSLGRIELVGTALHEPLLGTIPQRDAIGQLQSHATMLRRTLGARPTGGWVPHGAWDPSVPLLFQKAGLHWTTLDREVLDRNQCPAAPVLSIERFGRTVALIPSRRLTPRAWAGLAVLSVRTPQDVRVLSAALPRTSALPHELASASRARAYLPGESGWEQVLLGDAGADRLHKRMLSVSRMVHRVETNVERSKHEDGGPDPRQLEQVRRYLYRAQSAEALVPIRPGGAVSGTYRDRAWRDLIRAETIALEALPVSMPWIRSIDEDCDGSSEVRVLTDAWAITVAPAQEGALTELVHRESATNLVGNAVPVAFRERWNEGAPVSMHWELVTSERPTPTSARVTTLAEGLLEAVPVQVLKAIQVHSTGPLEFRLEVRSNGGGAIRGLLSTELFLSLGGPHLDGDDDCAMSVEVAGGKVPMDEVIDLPSLDAIGLCGWRSRVDVTVEPPARVTLEPLDEGAARVVFWWTVDILTGDVGRCKLNLSVREVTHG